MTSAFLHLWTASVPGRRGNQTPLKFRCGMASTADGGFRALGSGAASDAGVGSWADERHYYHGRARGYGARGSYLGLLSFRVGSDPDAARCLRSAVGQFGGSIPVVGNMSKAREFLEALLVEVCFQKEDKCRSLAVVLAEMLTLYCTHLLPPGALRPGFLFSGNAEGSGKTTLAFLAIIPRLGYAAAACAPKDEDEMRKEILAVALAGKPVFFLDNVKHHLSSSSLERLMTAPLVEGRILGESREVTIPHNVTVVITGNGATISPDLRRRLLIVELFMPEAKAELHVFQNPLTYEEIVGLAPEILAALWALVRHWRDQGCPPPSRSLNGFGAWSATVAAIVECAEFGSPCVEPANLKFSGDKATADIERLAERMNPGTKYTFSQLAELASDHDLFDWIIGQEGALDASAKSALGKLFKRCNDRIFEVTDDDGKMRRAKFCVLGKDRKERRYCLQLSVR